MLFDPAWEWAVAGGLLWEQAGWAETWVVIGSVGVALAVVQRAGRTGRLNLAGWLLPVAAGLTVLFASGAWWAPVRPVGELEVDLTGLWLFDDLVQARLALALAAGWLGLGALVGERSLRTRLAVFAGLAGIAAMAVQTVDAVLLARLRGWEGVIEQAVMARQWLGTAACGLVLVLGVRRVRVGWTLAAVGLVVAVVGTGGWMMWRWEEAWEMRRGEAAPWSRGLAEVGERG